MHNKCSSRYVYTKMCANVCRIACFCLCTAYACFCVLLCVMDVVGCVFVICVCLGMCLCVSGFGPSILLTPSGLCVGLFQQHYHLLVFYSGPRATMTAEPSRFAHQAHQIGSLTSNLAPISYRRTNLSLIPWCSLAESRWCAVELV